MIEYLNVNIDATYDRSLNTSNALHIIKRYNATLCLFY